MGDAAAEAVDEAGHFLNACAGGGHDADVTAAHDVGQGERDAGDDGRTAVGAHHEKALLNSLLLQLDFILDGDVIGEEHDVESAVDGTQDIQLGHGARQGNHAEVGVFEAVSGLLDGGGLEFLGLGTTGLGLEVSLHVVKGGLDGSIVLRFDADHEVAGGGSVNGRVLETEAGDDVLVADSAQKSEHLADAVEFGGLAGNAHQAHGILVLILINENFEKHYILS